jgi:hypothetical protein
LIVHDKIPKNDSPLEKLFEAISIGIGLRFFDSEFTFDRPGKVIPQRAFLLNQELQNQVAVPWKQVRTIDFTNFPWKVDRKTAPESNTPREAVYLFTLKPVMAASGCREETIGSRDTIAT